MRLLRAKVAPNSNGIKHQISLIQNRMNAKQRISQIANAVILTQEMIKTIQNQIEKDNLQKQLNAINVKFKVYQVPFMTLNIMNYQNQTDPTLIATRRKVIKEDLNRMTVDENTKKRFHKKFKKAEKEMKRKKVTKYLQELNPFSTKAQM